MKISPIDSQTIYQHILDDIETIASKEDIEFIRSDIAALRDAGAWYHASLAASKLKAVLNKKERVFYGFDRDGNALIATQNKG